MLDIVFELYYSIRNIIQTLWNILCFLVSSSVDKIGNSATPMRGQTRSILLSKMPALEEPQLQESLAETKYAHDALNPDHSAVKKLDDAFLNENDYPIGWLVYHPILGVVEKSEADNYDSRSRAFINSHTDR